MVVANVTRFDGFADCYDDHRPAPPPILADIFCWWAEVRRPRLVVDLGSGTGLSTRFWAGRADAVIGIEPNADMRACAEARSAGLQGVRYQEGVSAATGLPDGCADIVTVSQALHWMEPEPTFAEVARILRPGGVFAAYDCDWPPTVRWEVEQAYLELTGRVAALERKLGASPGVHRWGKDAHLARIRASGGFRFTKEVTLHHGEAGGADRLVGLTLSQGSLQALLRCGLSESEIGIDTFRETARRVMGDAPLPWLFSYRVRLGVK